jgi:hypothetical protein
VKFKNIEDIKSRGEFIKKGKIFPSRILKCSKRKMQHCVKSGSNQWAFPTKKGYLIFIEINASEFSSTVYINNVCNVNIDGSPYSKGGTHWQINSGLNDVEFTKLFNEIYLNKNK